jgi:preprotein translocase subunit SecY
MGKLAQIFRVKELRNKVLVILGLLVVFRMLANIPIPGIDPVALNQFLSSNQLFGFINIFSGGALNNLSIAMLGVGPYITGTIIMQLLTIIFPQLKKAYYEEGPSGQAKFNRYSRYLMVPLAALQGYAFLKILVGQNALLPLTLFELVRNVSVITAGTVFLVWIGDLIDERKLGNGISMIIFAGILAGLPTAVRNIVFAYDPSMLPTYISFLVVSIIIVAGVIFVNEGERKIPVSYAKRVRGTKVYGGVSTYLPLKVNQAGVIPIIFAVSILVFPQFFAQILSLISSGWATQVNEYITLFMNNKWAYGVTYFLLVVVFTYFYTAIVFEPHEISKNLQRGGGFIPGIRPGEPTTQFLKSIVYRITVFGSLFLGFLAVLPNIIQGVTGVTFLAFGGTTLLIVVSVALEMMRQIDSQLTMREYEGIQ